MRQAALIPLIICSSAWRIARRRSVTAQGRLVHLVGAKWSDRNPKLDREGGGVEVEGSQARRSGLAIGGARLAADIVDFDLLEAAGRSEGESSRIECDTDDNAAVLASFRGQGPSSRRETWRRHGRGLLLTSTSPGRCTRPPIARGWRLWRRAWSQEKAGLALYEKQHLCYTVPS